MKRALPLIALALSFALLAGLQLPQPAAAELDAAGPPMRVNSYEVAKQHQPVAFSDRPGRFSVIWETDHLGLRLRRFVSDGSPLGDEVLLVENVTLGTLDGEGPTAYRTDAAVVPTQNGFYLFWTEESAYTYIAPFREYKEVQNQEIFGRQFRGDGSPVGARFRVSPNGMAGFQSRPAALLHPHLGLVVAWESDDQVEGVTGDDGVFVRFLGLDGTPAGPAVKLSSAPDAEARRPALAAAPDGTLLAVWEACCTDGSQEGVFARLLDRDGSLLGDQMQINTSELGRQRRPSTAARPDGTFLVAWQGYYQEPLDARIFAQAVNRQGVLVGPEVMVSQGEGNAHISPVVTRATRGNLVIGWLAFNEYLPISVSAVEVDQVGNPISQELNLAVGPIGSQRRLTLADDGTGGLIASWEGFLDEDLGINARRIDSNPDNRVLGLNVE